jgi:DNA-binding CsgD family transcriptional regulator
MPVPDLTLTEERIALLAAAGKSRREIAAAVALDERTVEWHMARAARKLEQLSTLHRRLTQQRRLGSRRRNA